jgi:hypothetical protein
MVDRAENQNSRATTTFSMPTPDFFQAAKRARGKALRDMILAFVKWARSGTADQPSRGAASTGAMRAGSKH